MGKSKFDSYVHYACGSIHFHKFKNDDDGTLRQEFVKFCESYSKITKYYLILHNEIEDDLHIHFIFYSLSQVQLLTYFNKLRDYFINSKKLVEHIDNIGIEKCISINAHLKYMLHLDTESISKNKQQYALSDFISNDDEDIIDTLIHSKKGQLDAFYLRDAILDCHDDFELMVHLGLNVYHRYSREIETLKEMRILLSIQRENERKERLERDLPF